jgi:hypothetical protein
MLSVEDFPVSHAGVCKECAQERRAQRRSTTLVSESVSDSGSDLIQLPRQNLPKHHSVPDSQRTTGSSSSQPRRSRQATLPSSVTFFSDIGQYPSGGSTYGMSRPGQRRLNKTRVPQASNNRRSATLFTQDRTVDQELSEAEGLIQFLTSKEISDLRQRKASRALLHVDDNNDNDDDTIEPCNNPTRSSLPDESNIPLENSLPSGLTVQVHKCLVDICKVWGIQNLTSIFPRRIWPNEGTTWSLGVLQIFHTMARQYPSSTCRDGISKKFCALVTARRHTLNAKSQWTIKDANTTSAWAKQEYGTPPPSQHESEHDSARGDGLRLSQRPRMPSKKAVALLQSSGNVNRRKRKLQDIYKRGASNIESERDYSAPAVAVPNRSHRKRRDVYSIPSSESEQ